MSIAKNKKAQCSPLGLNPDKKQSKCRFDLSQRNLEKLQCFIRKRSVKGDKKRISRIKSNSSALGRFQPERPQTELQKEQSPTDRLQPPEERNRRASERCLEVRKKEQSTSPDLAKTLMNQVIYKIESEGVNSEWKEDDQRKGEDESESEMENVIGEVNRIWRPVMPVVQEAQRSYVSTERETAFSENASGRNSYYGGSPYIMMPMQHISFNSSFSYGSEQKLYPEYFGYKWPAEKPEINKRIFEINYDLIEKDMRTTVMIKNIPNKYSLKLLSDEIDEKHANQYDFLYLPFDFENNCNVGYAFINFLDTSYLKAFYENFNNKKWLKFKSFKICLLTYARLQGRNSLIEHFSNSKVLNQKEKRYRPIIKQMSGLSKIVAYQQQRWNNQQK